MLEKSLAYKVALSPATSSANAFVDLFASAVAKGGYEVVNYKWGFRDIRNYHVIVFHWPDQFLAPKTTLSALGQLARLILAKKTSGLKCIWVAHNLHPHNVGEGRSFVQRIFLKNLDGIIYLSEQSRDMVRAHHDLPKAIVECVTVHGSYPGEMKPFSPRPSNGPIRLISFGLIRPYKNLHALVCASEQLDDKLTELHIVGMRLDQQYSDDLEGAGANNPSVQFDLRDDFLTNEELNAILDCADGIVLPYTKIMNSGSAIHALSRGKPVLVPAMGSMPELREMVGSSWVSLFDGQIDGEDLAAFAEHVRNIPPDARPNMAPLSWDRVAKDLDKCLQTVIDRDQKSGFKQQ